MTLKLLGDRKDMYIYPWYISDITATKDISSIAPLNVKKAFVTIEKDFLSYYYDIESANEIGKSLLSKIISDRDFFREVVQNIYKSSGELLDFCEIETKRDVKSLYDQELLKIYETYIDKLRLARTWGWVPVFVDGLTETFLSEHLQGEFRKYMEQIGKADKVSEYYSLLSSTEKMSEVQKEEVGRLELLLESKQNPKWEDIKTLIVTGDLSTLESNYSDIHQLFIKHIKNFGWLTYAYSGPAMTLGHLQKLIKDNLESTSIKEQLEKIKNHYQDLSKNKKEIIEEIKLPTDLEYLFIVSAELMFMKDYRKGTYQKSYLAMDNILSELAERIGITLKAIKYATINELKETLESNKDIKNITDKRLENCCYVAEGGNISIYEGKKCDELKNNLVEKSNQPAEETSELKGLTAYRGVVKGIVKIVLTVEDVSKVNEGDILVSSSTNPDLILAMKKAAAFVTDIGGITSHAAIVSRELKKPCIVGTSQATHILKDGDLIEVDADRGVVRKIK